MAFVEPRSTYLRTTKQGHGDVHGSSGIAARRRGWFYQGKELVDSPTRRVASETV